MRLGVAARAIAILATMIVSGPTLARKRKVETPRWEPENEVVDRYNEGVNALNRQNNANAARAFRDVLDDQPSCGLAMLGLGQALMRQGALDKAIPMFAAVATAFPDQPDPHLMLAESLFAVQDFAASRDYAIELVRMAPDLFEARYLAFRAMIRLGEYDAAERLLQEEAATGTPNETACLDVDLSVERGEVEAARGSMAACERSSSPELQAEARSRLAHLMGDVDAQVEAARSMGADSITDEGEIVKLMNAGKYREAHDRLTSAIETGSKDPLTLVRRASCRIQLGMTDGAKRDLESLFASKAWIDVERGGALTGIVTKSSEVEMEDAVRVSLAALVVLLVEQEELDEAEVALRKAEARFGRVADLVAARSVLVGALEGPAAAWELLRRAVESWPNDPDIVRAAAHAAFGDAKGAPASVVAAIRASGTWMDRYNLAVGYNNARMATECVVEARAVAGLAPADARSQVDALGYGCAVAASDAAATAEFRARIQSSGTLPTGPALQDAWNHLRAGDADDALSILRDLDLTDPADRASAGGIAIEAHLDAGHLDDALAQAAIPGIDPRTRYNLAVALMRAKRDREAVGVLEPACPEMEGQDRTACEELLARLRQ